jgi:hypothetical protein
MRHVSAALGSSAGSLIGSSSGWSVNVRELPVIGRSWPSLRPAPLVALADGADLVDLEQTDAEVARLRPEVARVRRS